jgi:hypothetical protein
MYNIDINYIVIFLLIIIIVSHYISPNEKFIDAGITTVPNTASTSNVLAAYDNSVFVIDPVLASNTWSAITSFTNFPDNTAQWIWYKSFASNRNIEKYQFSFNYIYNQTMSKTPLQVYLFIIVDNSCVVFLNNAFVSKCSGGWDKNPIPSTNILPILLVPGNNFFEFYLANNIGPSGFVCTVINPLNNSVVFNSNKSWTFINYGIPLAFNNNYNLSLTFP